MAFVVKVLFLSALVYRTNAGLLNGQVSDSYVSSALNAPSASFGPPSTTYGLPNGGQVQQTVIEDHGPISIGADLHGAGAPGPIFQENGPTGGGFAPIPNDQGLIGGGYGSIASGSGPIASGPAADLTAPGIGSGVAEGSLHLDSTLAGAGGAASAAVGAPRVIGTTVTVGHPDASQTRYELQSVIQNVVRRIPVEVTRHVKVAVPQAVPVPVRQEVKVPVPQPYPVHVDVVKHVPYPVYKTEHVTVERPVPVEVIKQVPVEIIKEVPVPVERPYEVIKKVHVPVEKHIEVPVDVWKPYPLHIIKHVTHYKKKSCCW